MVTPSDSVAKVFGLCPVDCLKPALVLLSLQHSSSCIRCPVVKWHAGIASAQILEEARLCHWARRSDIIKGWCVNPNRQDTDRNDNLSCTTMAIGERCFIKLLVIQCVEHANAFVSIRVPRCLVRKVPLDMITEWDGCTEDKHVSMAA